MKRQSNNDRTKQIKLDRQAIREIKTTELEQNVTGGLLSDAIGADEPGRC